jgi:hypothetical protein
MDLKTCPLCGKPVEVALCGDYERQYYKIHHERCKKNKCTMVFESDSFDPELATNEELKLIELNMIDNWNRRVVNEGTA